MRALRHITATRLGLLGHAIAWAFTLATASSSAYADLRVSFEYRSDSIARKLQAKGVDKNLHEAQVGQAICERMKNIDQDFAPWQFLTDGQGFKLAFTLNEIDITKFELQATLHFPNGTAVNPLAWSCPYVPTRAGVIDTLETYPTSISKQIATRLFSGTTRQQILESLRDNVPVGEADLSEDTAPDPTRWRAILARDANSLQAFVGRVWLIECKDQPGQAVGVFAEVISVGSGPQPRTLVLAFLKCCKVRGPSYVKRQELLSSFPKPITMKKAKVFFSHPDAETWKLQNAARAQGEAATTIDE